MPQERVAPFLANARPAPDWGGAKRLPSGSQALADKRGLSSGHPGNRHGRDLPPAKSPGKPTPITRASVPPSAGMTRRVASGNPAMPIGRRRKPQAKGREAGCVAASAVDRPGGAWNALTRRTGERGPTGGADHPGFLARVAAAICHRPNRGGEGAIGWAICPTFGQLTSKTAMGRESALFRQCSLAQNQLSDYHHNRAPPLLSIQNRCESILQTLHIVKQCHVPQ